MGNQFDVAIIGAGPAGCSAAIALQKCGISVAVIEKHFFPRDKICGDALIPDALKCISDLGLGESISNLAYPVESITLNSPRGIKFNVKSKFSTIRRYDFDNFLLEEARKVGATIFFGCEMKHFYYNDSKLIFYNKGNDGQTFEIFSSFGIICTGSRHNSYLKSTLSSKPTAFAMRQYVRTTPDVAKNFESLQISFSREISPGYGWIFPLGNNEYNIGSGFFLNSKTEVRNPNLNQIHSEFISTFEPARAILSNASDIERPKGAPLSTGLKGNHAIGAQCLVAGEALGTTYDCTGEGIGKAMQSAQLASECIFRQISGEINDASKEYREQLNKNFRPFFEGYEAASKWLDKPIICDIMCMIAKRSNWMQNKTAAMIEELSDPRDIFSCSGVIRGIFR